MADSWLEYIQITQHPFLERFSNGRVVERVYEDAVRGLSRIYMQRPESWYPRAASVSDALERLGDMVLQRIAVEGISADLQQDLLAVLELSEESDSIDLIKRIFAYYDEDEHSSNGRSWGRMGSPDGPATEPQRKYLRKLGAVGFKGTKAEASRLIEELKTK